MHLTRSRYHFLFEENESYSIASGSVSMSFQACEALLLLAKSMTIFRSGLRSLRRLVQDDPLILQDPEVKIKVEELRSKFNECVSNMEKLKISEKVLLSNSQDTTNIQSAEQIIYEYAVLLCREAAQDENEELFLQAKTLYTRAIHLLQVVHDEAEGTVGRLF